MKKKISLILAASFTLFSVCHPFAATVKKIGNTQKATVQNLLNNSEKVTLTVEEAAEKAINYSHELKNMENAQELAKKNEDDARKDLFLATEYLDVTSLAVQFKTFTNAISNYEKNTSLQKDKIVLSVYNLFAAIIQAEDNIKLYEKNMDIEERNLKIAETKLKLGLISESEYNDIKVNYNKLKSDLQTLKNALDTSYTNLSKIMGYDLSTEYTLTLDNTYTPIDPNINLTSKITSDTAKSLKLKEAKDNVTVKKYSYDVYSALYSKEKKEAVRNDYLSATRTAESTKTNIEAQEKELYNQIINLETSYNTNKEQLEKLQYNIEIKKKQLDLGKITQIEYDKAEYEIENLKCTIKQQIYRHNALMMQFNNIDLVL